MDKRLKRGSCGMLLVLAIAALSHFQTSLAVQLIVNGGAERGRAKPDRTNPGRIPGWYNKGMTVSLYGSEWSANLTESRRITGGRKYFAGGFSNDSTMVQNIRLSNYRELISSGKAKATLMGYLGAQPGTDFLYVQATFLSNDRDNLGSIFLAPLTRAENEKAGLYYPSVLNGFVFRQASMDVPPRARIVGVTVRATRGRDDDFCDAFVDNLQLHLTK